jgi:hypothetical protein
VPWDFERARKLGINIQDVARSWATHLSGERQKLRDNPELAKSQLPPEKYDLAVEEVKGPAGVRWQTLGQLPWGIAPIRVEASSADAARNGQPLPELLRQRYLAEFGRQLMAAGLYPLELEGKRAAMRAAYHSSISVVDARALVPPVRPGS